MDLLLPARVIWTVGRASANNATGGIADAAVEAEHEAPAVSPSRHAIHVAVIRPRLALVFEQNLAPIDLDDDSPSQAEHHLARLIGVLKPERYGATARAQDRGDHQSEGSLTHDRHIAQ